LDIEKNPITINIKVRGHSSWQKCLTGMPAKTPQAKIMIQKTSVILGLKKMRVDTGNVTLKHFNMPKPVKIEIKHTRK
jgi:hypothetical protein